MKNGNGQPCFWCLLKCDSNTVLYLLYHSYWNHHVCKGNNHKWNQKPPNIGFCGYIDGCINSPSLDISFTGNLWSFQCSWKAESSKKKIIANACAGQWDVFLFHMYDMWQVSQKQMEVMEVNVNKRQNQESVWTKILVGNQAFELWHWWWVLIMQHATCNMRTVGMWPALCFEMSPDERGADVIRS